MKRFLVNALILLIIMSPYYSVTANTPNVLYEEDSLKENPLSLNDPNSINYLVKSHSQKEINNAVSIAGDMSPLQTFLVTSECFLRKVETAIVWKSTASKESVEDLILDIVEINSSNFKVISSMVKHKNEIPKFPDTYKDFENTVFEFNPGIPLKANTTYGIRLKSPDSQSDGPFEAGYEWRFFGFGSPLGDKYSNGALFFNNNGGAYEDAHGDAAFSIYVSKGTFVLKIGQPYMTINEVKKDIDGSKQTSPVIKNGRTLIPIRALIEQMGGNMTWSSAEKKLLINLNTKVIELWINSKTVLVNGIKKLSDAEPIIINGRTFVPLRIITENLGCKLEWQPNEKTITIIYGNLDFMPSNVAATPTPVMNTNSVNINFNELYNASNPHLNWYFEDQPIPAEIEYNQNWLRSRGLEITGSPKGIIHMTKISGAYATTQNIVGFASPNFTDNNQGISGIEEVLSLRFIESPIKSVEVEFCVSPSARNLNILSKVKMEAFDSNNKLVKSDLFEFIGIKDGIYSTKKFKIESEISFSKLSISSPEYALGGLFICSINYDKN